MCESFINLKDPPFFNENILLMFLKHDPYQMNPLLEYIANISPEDTDKIYEISVRIPEIIQHKYKKYGNPIENADQLTEVIHSVCVLINTYSDNYKLGVENTDTILNNNKTKKNMQTYIENEDERAVYTMRWITMFKLMHL